jgi:hypothetical protein
VNPLRRRQKARGDTAASTRQRLGSTSGDIANRQRVVSRVDQVLIFGAGQGDCIGIGRDTQAGLSALDRGCLGRRANWLSRISTATPQTIAASATLKTYHDH